jgi:hypothetical protein
LPHLQALPGASFVVNGGAGFDSALARLARKKWLNGWSAAATFEGEFSDVTRPYAGKGVVRYVVVVYYPPAIKRCSRMSIERP